MWFWQHKHSILLHLRIVSFDIYLYFAASWPKSLLIGNEGLHPSSISQTLLVGSRHLVRLVSSILFAELGNNKAFQPFFLCWLLLGPCSSGSNAPHRNSSPIVLSALRQLAF